MSETNIKDSTTDTSYAEVAIEHKKGSEVEITGEVPVPTVAVHRSKAIQKIQKNLELPGFRKGHVPEDMLVKHVGEQQIMQEVAELALGAVYADIVRDHALDVVGRPQVTITKLAPGNPIGFKIVSAVYPKVALPDYKKLSNDVRKKQTSPEAEEIADAELEAELKRLQKMMAGPAEKGEDGKEKEPELPALDDAFAKQMGAFENLQDMKDMMRKQMQMTKQQKTREKNRLEIIDAILQKTKMDVPQVFVDGELDQMIASFESQVKRAGMEMDAYLSQAKKTVEDLRKEWTDDALKRAKMQIIFNEISQQEKILPDVEKLEREVSHIKEHYPDADEQSVRVYVMSQMTNEKVFQLLEGKQEVADDDMSHKEHE